jgi:Domain of unknown function (DUF4747)
VWTEIDIDGAWLDLAKEDELPAALKNTIAIPENAKPNYRTFDYVFDDRQHRLYFEARTELGATLGATTAKRIFSSLLSQEIQGPDSPEVEVTVVPDEKAVDAVLGLPGLRNLTIRVVLPNPDTTSSAAQRRVSEQMRAMGVRLAEENYVKSSQATRIEPNTRVREQAQVAAENGFVRGEGRTADGRKLEAATDRQPRRHYLSVDRGDTFLARLLGTLRIGR